MVPAHIQFSSDGLNKSSLEAVLEIERLEGFKKESSFKRIFSKGIDAYLKEHEEVLSGKDKN